MNRRDRILAIAACLLWSTAIVGVKWGLEYLPPLTLAGTRFILSGALLSWGLIKEEHPDILSLCGMLLVVIGIIISQRESAVR